MVDRIAAVVLASLVALGSPAVAQQSEPQCPAQAEPVSAALSGWGAGIALASGADAAAAAVLVPGKRYDLHLMPMAAVTYPTRLAKEDVPGFGGIAAVSVSDPGTYRVALGSAPWVDVVRDGTALESIAHGHGPACSGIHKVVDFTLTPGRYFVTISGNETADVPIMIARLP